MDPLSAVGIAASVVQFISFGAKVTTRLKEYSSASTEVPKSLQHITAQLPLLLNALDRIKTSIEVERIDLDTRCILKGVVSGCRQQVEKIDKIIDKVLHVPGDSLVTRVQKVFVSLKNDDKILEIEKSLQTYIQVLILHRVIEGQDDSWLINEDSGFFEVRIKKVSPFDERKELIGKIETAIQPAVTSQALNPIRIILSGKEGAGKTQLALEFCHQANADGHFRTIFWTNAATPETLGRSLESISDTIRRSKEGLKNRDDKIQFVKSFLCNRWHPWLLVLDNFDPSGFENDSPQLPDKGSGAILFTSRSQSFPDHDKVIEVPQYLSPDDIYILKEKLIYEVNKNDISRVEELVLDGADPDWTDEYGWSCLRIAVRQSHTDLVKVLLKHRAKSRRPNQLQGAPYDDPVALVGAAQSGNTEITKILLNHEDAIGITPKSPGNSAALRAAAEKGHANIVRILIEHGSVDAESQDENEETALGIAAMNGRTAVVQTLIHHGANVNGNSRGEAPLVWATKEWHLETVKVLCDEGKAQVNARDSTSIFSQPPLWHAVLPRGGPGDWNDMVRRSEEMVQYLLESGADPNLWNKYSSSPLQRTVSRGLGINGVRSLLDHGADPYPLEGGSTGTYPPIVEAARSGSEPIVKLLLGAKARDTTTQTRQLEQALLMATKHGKRDTVLLLLEAGVEINTPGNRGATPLILAIDERQIPTARLLLRRGANETIPDDAGRLPLFMAAEKGLDVLVKEIVKKTQDPNVRCTAMGDNTALCVAAANGHVEVVRFLLEEARADKDLANKFGDTALDFAEEGGHGEVVALLEKTYLFV